MNEPLVSVIIPCYNAEVYLKDAIQSIIDQTYNNLEVLVIDDGCTDNSSLIYNEFAQKDKRIQIEKNETNIGLINTLNKGIDMASGEFIARMDADDISAPNRIEEQVSFMLNNQDISVLGTKAKVIDLNGTISENKSLYTYLESETLQFSSFFSQPLIHGSVLIRTKVLQENKYDLDFKYAEDFELWLRLISKGYRLSNLPSKLYYYRKNPKSVSNQNTTNQIKTHNMISKIYLEEFCNKRLNKELIEIVNNRPQNPINPYSLKNALFFFDSIYQKYNKNHSHELKVYRTRQAIDICIQALKSNSKKASQLRMFILLIPYLRDKIGFQYLIEKIKK